jgi:hypothetical protein
VTDIPFPNLPIERTEREDPMSICSFTETVLPTGISRLPLTLQLEPRRANARSDKPLPKLAKRNTESVVAKRALLRTETLDPNPNWS